MWVRVLTKRRLSLRQSLQHGVEGADEQIVPQLHDGEPQQMEHKELGQHAVLVTPL